MIQYQIDTSEALTALQEVNKKIAACFKKEVKEVKFSFTPHIARAGKGYMVLGECLHQTSEIQIVPNGNWRETAIHELIHLYNPMMSEAKVTALTTYAIRYLKAFRVE